MANGSGKTGNDTASLHPGHAVLRGLGQVSLAPQLNATPFGVKKGEKLGEEGKANGYTTPPLTDTQRGRQGQC